MNKFLIACSVIVGLGGNSSSALADSSAGALYDQPAAQLSAVSATDLPHTVAHLLGRVKALENEVQALRTQSQSAQDENAQDLNTIPTGG